jgi:bifunctional DNA-binding transcriptional regulator/antitoxin component of YhaV-PrlF toxin-antitoxin module
MATGAQPSSPPETVSLAPDGEVRISERLRSRLGWREGDKLVVTADEAGDVKVLTVHDAVRSVRGMLTPHSEGRLLSEELIEERRREAGRE